MVLWKTLVLILHNRLYKNLRCLFQVINFSMELQYLCLLRKKHDILYLISVTIKDIITSNDYKYDRTEMLKSQNSQRKIDYEIGHSI